MAACVREYTLEIFTLLNAKGKKELIEWCLKEGLVASSYDCPKCNNRHDVTWLAIKRFLRNRTSHAEGKLKHAKSVKAQNSTVGLVLSELSSMSLDCSQNLVVHWYIANNSLVASNLDVD
ncbi:uncharacterized protein TNCV_5116341 [Trichonephila clavipes]|nr:uncharacterized protein TNCV_5116341 [Trichonephila clavipes]